MQTDRDKFSVILSLSVAVVDLIIVWQCILNDDGKIAFHFAVTKYF